ncbi:MAG: PA14 domain-containing protein [Saprospiraceae bacterium]
MKIGLKNNRRIRRRWIRIGIFLLFLFGLSMSLQAQCSGGSQVGSLQTPCNDQSNNVGAISYTKYIAVNVVKGVNYKFSNGSGITLYNDATNTQVAYTSGSSISYTSEFTGILRVYSCSFWWPQTITFEATNQGSNTEDNQSDCGADSWIGHMYKRMDSNASAPSNANAFTSYVGYFTESETFSENFGASQNCFATYSAGSNRINTYTEYFAVKFCNQSVRPKGAYIISAITADDGVRLSVDGTLVMNKWVQQSATTYSKILFEHSGNSQLLLEYYESAGQNQISFGTMTRVNNNLTSNISQVVCSGSSPSQIGGTNTLTTSPVSSTSGYSVSYQWQISTDNINFTNISGATSMNYTPTLSTNGTYYYRRIASVSYTNPGTIPIVANDISNVATVVYYNKPNGTFTGSTICEGESTAQLLFTSSAGIGPFSLVINGITYNNVTSGVPIQITAPTSTTIYNLTKITDSNGCVNP